MLLLRWWGDSLYRGLPTPLRFLFRSDMPRLGFKLVNDQTLEVSWADGAKHQRCAEYRLDGALDVKRLVKKHAKARQYHLELILDNTQVLKFQHTFPEAVQENLNQVVAYQLDRLTPFSADKLYFDVKIAQHNKTRQEIQADIYIAPIKPVEQLKQQLYAQGIPKFDRISLANSDLTLRAVTESEADTKQPSWSYIPLYFLITALVLSLALPTMYKQRRLDQINHALHQLRQHTSAQLELRDKLMAAEASLLFVQQRQKNTPSTLLVLEQLSQLIPRHTWLERLEIREQEVHLRGESSQALSLLDVLESAPHFSQVSFRSPITRSPNSEHERFYLQAFVETQP